MEATNKPMSWRGRLRLAQWTFFGTAGCLVISIGYNYLSFRQMGGEALARGLISAVILPMALAGPLFFYLTLKLRELAIANHRLREVASVDALTGCLNRGAFAARVQDQLARPDAGRGCLLVVDADRFKRINDGFGHGVGDDALVTIAHAIAAAVPETALVGRLGGEEFGVFAPGFGGPSARQLAERILTGVASAAFAPGGVRWPLSVSVGVAEFEGETVFSELFRRADQCLYLAKAAGRNRVEVEHEPAPPRHASHG